MKKLIALAAVAACGAALAVESANIVGYSTINSPAANKFCALTVSFEDVTNGSAIKIKDLLTGTFTGKPTKVDGADQIWLWDTANDTWVEYFFRRTVGSGATDIGWVKNGQADTSVETEDTIANGETFFFRRANGQASIPLTLSGAVKPFAAAAQYTGLAANKFKFIGYPWPVAMPIANFGSYMSPAPTGKPTKVDGADQIWRWDSENDEWIQYFYRRTVGAGAADIGWVRNGQADTSVPTTDVIPAGEGFFFRRANGQPDATVTFTYE